jgi:energy-coupling factor transporter ATP-binding protein EcfA2
VSVDPSDTLGARFVSWVEFAGGRGFKPTPVNVIVGPNGAGKSLMLLELNALLTESLSPSRLFTRREPPTQPRLLSMVRRETPADPSERKEWLLVRGYEIDESPGLCGLPTFTRMPRKKDLLKSERRPVQIQIDDVDLGDVGLGLTTWIHGVDRFSVVGGTRYTRAGTEPDDCWSFIMWAEPIKEFLQAIILNDLGFNLYFDVATHPGNLKPRCTSEELPDGMDELSVTRPLVDFYDDLPLLSEMSDGTQAYVTLMLANLTGSGRMLLVDEPEAFLHPPLARTAGQRSSMIAQLFGHTIFAATHSAHFLMGCLDSGVDVTVIRLAFDGDVQSVTRLDPATLRNLYRDPLLRSSRVLQGIFHEAVVVGEGEADRAFYEEINRRLTDAEDEDCSASTMFVCGHGKHTLHRIVAPLRQLGIPTAAIVDLDILKDGGMKPLMDAAGYPQVASQQQGHIRKVLKDQLWRDGAVANLSAETRAELREFCDTCAAYGVFIVPGGAVESWLSELGVHVDKSRWVAAIFDRMGFDSSTENYVTPSDSDVWDFLRGIGTWLSDPDRKGLKGLDGLEPTPDPEQIISADE